MNENEAKNYSNSKISRPYYKSKIYKIYWYNKENLKPISKRI